MLEFPFLCRWREASGVDAACNTCSDVKGTSSGSGVIGSGGPTWVADRKSRDVSTKEEGMSIKSFQGVYYLIKKTACFAQYVFQILKPKQFLL